MNRCNHGPSRFYRTSFGFAAWSALYHATVTAMADWRGKSCSAPETTETCATNARNCN